MLKKMIAIDSLESNIQEFDQARYKELKRTIKSGNKVSPDREDILSTYIEQLNTGKIGDLAIIKFKRGLRKKTQWLVLRVENIVEVNGRRHAVVNSYFTNEKPDSQIKLDSIFKDKSPNTHDPRLEKCFRELTYKKTEEELSTTTYNEEFLRKDEWQITSELSAFDIENHIEVYNFSKKNSIHFGRSI